MHGLHVTFSGCSPRHVVIIWLTSAFHNNLQAFYDILRRFASESVAYSAYAVLQQARPQHLAEHCALLGPPNKKHLIRDSFELSNISPSHT
jgi:hypothetical protein